VANQKQEKAQLSMNKKKQQLLTDLTSGNPKTVSAAITALHVHGDSSMIPTLLEAWDSGLNEKNEEELRELLIGLKDSSAVEPLMEAFRNSDDNVLRRKLMNVFWNSKLDFSEYLSDFVVFAIEGDFMDSLETLTVIENFEFNSPESTVLESQLLLKEFFGKDEAIEERKMQLLQDIALIVKDFETGSDMDDFYDED
jgi:hypothetical protein